MKDLPREFFARETVQVARDLIGCTLVVGRCEGRIVETEAYTDDEASHAVTRRHTSHLMQQTWGHVYVYLIYGMHCCLNFTTDRLGPGAVLIRAIEPTTGLSTMIKRRRNDDPRLLASGPGRLCQAFGIDLSFSGGLIGSRIIVRPRRTEPTISTSPRIGITRARHLDWRFYETGSPHVSHRTKS